MLFIIHYTLGRNNVKVIPEKTKQTNKKPPKHYFSLFFNIVYVDEMTEDKHFWETVTSSASKTCIFWEFQCLWHSSNWCIFFPKWWMHFPYKMCSHFPILETSTLLLTLILCIPLFDIWNLSSIVSNTFYLCCCFLFELLLW